METESKMTAKEYLGQAYGLERKIISKLRQIKILRDNVQNITAVFNDIRVQTSQDSSRMEDRLLKIYDREKEIGAEVDRLLDLRAEIQNVIDAVPDPECSSLLELRYLCFYDWKDIADMMGYSENYVYKMHRKALEMVEVP